MAIERRMTEIIGPVGGKLHTGRSRNDQTTVDSKMHMRSTIREIQQDIVHLQKVIISKAENNINAIMLAILIYRPVNLFFCRTG